MIIYCITNNLNNKRYIGQTIRTLSQRWRRHCWQSTLEAQRMAITCAMRKYGVANFTIEKICECSSFNELDEKEKYYISLYNTLCPDGYNIQDGGIKNHRIMPEETKAKIKAKNTGKIVSEETRKLLSLRGLGRKDSEETLKRKSERRKGKLLPLLARENSIKASIKTYLFYDPSGKEVTIVNMSQFCKQMNLNKFKMCEVARNHRSTHKGWRLKKEADSCKIETTNQE